jgi:hypothetical protein
MTASLLPVLLTLHLLNLRQAPAGSELHIRLSSAVGSYSSRAGMPLQAVLIAPVRNNDGTVIPAGSIVAGTVRQVARVGLGIRHETASMDLNFDTITPAGKAPIPLAARVETVDNGRESVNRAGRILGERATGSLCYRVSGYIRAVIDWEPHALLADWVLKSLITELPEPEIYYAPGSEMTLVLTQPLYADATGMTAGPPALAPAERIPSSGPNGQPANLAAMAAKFPVRAMTPGSSRPADLTNVLLAGTQQEIEAAFRAAGWEQARPLNLRRRIRFIRATAERRAYGSAPMSTMLLNGRSADMSWQKSLNDVAKRDHLRIWRQPETWQGRPLWVAAATHDIDFAYLRHGEPFTHRIETDVDREREKVGYDLAFTSCVEQMDWIERSGVPRFTHNATGDPMTTDARMLVVVLNACQAPRLTMHSLASTSLPERPGGFERILRREILTTRSDILRTNPYYRSYEGGRFLITWMVRRLRRKPAALAAVSPSISARTPVPSPVTPPPGG